MTFIKNTLFLLFIFTSSICSAQKCKLEKNDVDGLTEYAVKRTTQELLLRVNNDPVFVKAQSIGDNRYLKLFYYTQGNFAFTDDREIKLITTLNDEVELFPRKVVKDTSKVDDLYNRRSMVIYKLSPEQYTMLTTNGIITFKYFVTTGWMEKNIKSSKQGTIQNLLKCVE